MIGGRFQDQPSGKWQFINWAWPWPSTIPVRQPDGTIIHKPLTTAKVR